MHTGIVVGGPGKKGGEVCCLQNLHDSVVSTIYVVQIAFCQSSLNKYDEEYTEHDHNQEAVDIERAFRNSSKTNKTLIIYCIKLMHKMHYLNNLHENVYNSTQLYLTHKT